jgi:Na+-transporting methylmalonyl-CoA/oxaloacetate decarboxylase gamma subunit
LNELSQGLSLSVIGILVTFAALGLLILVILLLKRIFPEKRDDQVFSNSIEGSQSRERLKEQAAAVAVAALLDQHQGTPNGSLGSLLEEPPSNWWKRGVDRVLGKERG